MSTPHSPATKDPGDGPPKVHGLRLVASERHRDRARDAGALEIPHRRAPQVVEREPRAGLHPCPPSIQARRSDLIGLP
jgi:hypothetical protein